MAPNGIVLPVRALSAAAAQAAADQQNKGKGVKGHTLAADGANDGVQAVDAHRTPHLFNPFGLPSIYVYELRVPPHVYLLTAALLYCIGPPALIPLVAFFFLYRWTLQKQNMGADAAGVGLHPALLRPSHRELSTAGDGSSMKGGMVESSRNPNHRAHVDAAGTQPTHHATHTHALGLPPKVPPSPLITHKKHPNIHSIFD